MTFYQQNIDFGIGRHNELVRVGERRALRLTKAVPEAKGNGGLVRKAAEWLGRQRASLSCEWLPGVRTAHSKRAVG